MLKGSPGSYVDKPIIIEPRDLDAFRGIILNQSTELDLRSEDITLSNVRDFDIFFYSDDHIRSFEIYRIDFAPNSYADFARARKTILDNTVRDAVVTTSNSIVDEVIPNKKYWYIFRAVDVHENISNPTDVVQFEIVDTGNSIFPVVEDYVFPKPEIEYAKPMKKYLMIKPSPIQETMPRQAEQNVDGLVQNPLLGANAKESVWGKKYKLRLTSKLTGKKVDINFCFKQKELEDKRFMGEDIGGYTPPGEGNN